MIDWSKIKYFKQEEFLKPECLRPGMIELLDKLRGRCMFSLIVTSSYRSEEHNKAVGGASNSSHLIAPDGYYSGIDFTGPGGIMGSSQLFTVVHEALLLGFNRIGLYKDMRHVHLDIEQRLDQDVLWID